MRLFIISIINIIVLSEFFAPALADGLQLESEWQQVSSNLLDSFQFSYWSQQRINFDGLQSPSFFWWLYRVYILQLVSPSVSCPIAFLLLTNTRSGRLGEIKFVFQNSSEIYAYHSGRILGCTCTICLYGQNSISGWIPCGSPCPPSHVWSYTLFALICCFRLFRDWSFCLYHIIIYIYYFIVSYLFLL